MFLLRLTVSTSLSTLRLTVSTYEKQSVIAIWIWLQSEASNWGKSAGSWYGCSSLGWVTRLWYNLNLDLWMRNVSLFHWDGCSRDCMVPISTMTGFTWEIKMNGPAHFSLSFLWGVGSPFLSVNANTRSPGTNCWVKPVYHGVYLHRNDIHGNDSHAGLQKLL